MSMKAVMIGIATIGSLVAGIGSADGQEAGNCMPMRLSGNEASATVSGTAEWGPPFPCYTFGGRAGQTATLKFTKAKDINTAFTVPGVVDNQNRYSFKMKSIQYRVEIYQTLRAAPAPFTFSVSFK